MNISGLLVGIFTFLIIGIFHVVVIKSEYYFSKNIWPFFLIIGILLLILSLYTYNMALSSIISILGITFLWSIKELFEQEERVKKGWFPSNPKRKNKL